MQFISRCLNVMLLAMAIMVTSCHAIEQVPPISPRTTATPLLIPTAIDKQTSTISETASLLPTVTPTPIPTTTVRSTVANALPAPLYFLGEDQQTWRLSGNDFAYLQLTAESQPIVDFDVSPVDGSLIYLVKENGSEQQEVPTQLIRTDAWGHNREVLADVTESTTVRWSPDGKQYAFDGPEGIYIASLGSVPALRIPLKHNIDFERFTVESWSPDGKSLLVYQWGGGPGWNSYVFNTEDETMVGLAGGCCTPTWRYDSSGVYFAIAGLGEVYPGLWFVSATTGESSPMVQPLQSTGDLLPWAAYPYSNKDFLRAFIGTEPPAAGWPYFLTMVNIYDEGRLEPVRGDEQQVLEALWANDGSGAIIVGYPETKAGFPNGEFYWLTIADEKPIKLGVRGHNLRWGVETAVTPNIVEQIGNYTLRIWNGFLQPRHLKEWGYYGTATLTHVDGRELIIPDANQVQPFPVSDINGDGYPDVALLMKAGGSHCCQGTAVYSLDDVPTQLFETWGNPYASGGRGDLRDLNQDGIFEFVINGLPFGDSGLAVLHYVPNQGYIGGSYLFPQVYEEVLAEIVARAEQFPDDPFAVDDVAINYLYMGLPIEAWINIARIYEVASRDRDLFDFHEELTRNAIHSHLFAAKPPGIRVIDDFGDQLESIAQTYQINDAGNKNQLTTSVLQLDSPGYWESYAVSHQLLLEYDMQGEAGQRYVGLERCFDEVQDWSQTPILDTAIRNPTDHPVTFFLQFGEGKRCGTEPFTGEVWRTAFMLQPNESLVLTVPLDSLHYFARTGWSPQQDGEIDLQQIGYFAFGVETDEPRQGALHISPIRLWP